ncbi:hypothetical protein ACP70R_045840 [Stipagrostis hirtigluma subsp. patula]
MQINEWAVGIVYCRSNLVLCTGSYVFRDDWRDRREEGVKGAKPRKLLGAHSGNLDGHRQIVHKERRNLHGRHRQVIHNRKECLITAAAVAAVSVLFALVCNVAALLIWCTRKAPEDEMSILLASLCPSGARIYHHRELVAATGGFCQEGKIGRGGFGPVYRGYLSDQDRHVAVKVLSQESSVQGMREFEAEVKVMTTLRHRNIVQLLGWSYGLEGPLLVYEFVPNGSLEKHLYDPHRILTWPDRYKIVLGVGSAILYLHTECDQCVLHGDIKPANILLDQCCNPKLGDFGLARLVDHETDSQTTQVVAGTVGYIDPEFVNSQRPRPESDVYSFGMVLLEIACGKRPTMAQSNGAPVVLLNWVRGMYHENSIIGAADRRLDGEFDSKQMRSVLLAGLWCTHHEHTQRPSIVQAMDFLRHQEAELPVLLENQSPGSVRSLEEIGYGDLSEEDSPFENLSANTAYHTSNDSNCLLEC